MTTVIGLCIVLIILALTYCVFELADAWEEYDLYEGYCKWHKSISTDGEEAYE